MLFKKLFNVHHKESKELRYQNVTPALSFDLIQNTQNLKMENGEKQPYELANEKMPAINFCRNVSLNP